MIGLIASAIGSAASLAGNIMPDKKVVDNLKVYTPNSSSFMNAGLFNNQVADIGLTETQVESTKPSTAKSLLQVGGSVMSMVGETVSGFEALSKPKPEEEPKEEKTKKEGK